MKTLKRLLPLFLLLFPSLTVFGEVSTRICEADGFTDFDGRDIMVGSRLTIIVSSDTAIYWSGGLFITGTDLDRGVLYGRDFNDVTMDWEGSRFEAAGDGARVWDWQEPGFHGFDLYGHSSAIAGDWFIIDYNSTDIGDCNVGFYDYDVSPFEPVYEHQFHHVPTRDFNNNNIVYNRSN